jgi:hypothetical protein
VYSCMLKCWGELGDGLPWAQSTQLYGRLLGQRGVVVGGGIADGTDVVAVVQ